MKKKMSRKELYKYGLQDVEGLNCTGWVQGDKPLLIARIAGRMYVDVSQSFANHKLMFSFSCADYKRRNWRESASNPCYRWTFIEAFWSEVKMMIMISYHSNDEQHVDVHRGHSDTKTHFRKI